VRCNRLLIAWLLCAAGASCGGAVAVVLWWWLPASFAVRQAGGAHTWMLVVLPVGFLVLVGAGILVGVWLSRRLLNGEELSALIRAPRNED